MPRLQDETPRYLGVAFGFAAQCAQVLLAREFFTVFHGNELSIALLFGLWLLFVSVGAAVGRVPAKWLAAAQLVVLPAAILAVRNLRAWFSTPTGQYLPLSGLILASAAILAIPCFLYGAQFAWISKRLKSAYALEAVGAALGAVLGTIAWNPFALAAVSMAPLFRRWGILACVGLLAASGPIDAWGHKRYWKGLNLVETRRSPHGTIAVIERGGERSIYQGGRLWTTLPERGEHAPLAFLVLAQHPHPRKVLVAGGGPVLVPELAKHPVLIDVLETDEELLAVAGVAGQGGDARRYLRSAGRYDVIFVAAGEPDTALVNRFYTVEFFRLVKAHLGEGGVFAVGPLAAPATYSAEELMRRNATMYRTIASVFKNVLVTPGSAAWLIASDAELTLDEMTMQSRARDDLNIYALTEKFYVEKAQAEFRTGVRYNPLEDEPASATGGDLNTDARPVGYFQSLRAWAWQSNDSASKWLAAGEKIPLWIFFAVLAAPVVLRRRAVAMFHVGFAGMALSLGGLLGLHAAVGGLQAYLGLLIAIFMIGSAVGASVSLHARIALAITALAGGWLWLFPASVWSGAALLIGGFAVGAAFRSLSDLQTAARVYAFDVAGGCLAAFLAAPLLLPLYGAGMLGLVAAVPCALSAAGVRLR